MMRPLFFMVVCVVAVLIAFAMQTMNKPIYDCIIRNATVYDGTGSSPFLADIAIHHDTIAAIGDLRKWKSKKELDASGLAVAPGFINMLSWANDNLIHDGRSVSGIKQGVTLEIFGEGFSPGPIKRKSRREADTTWTTLGEYFDFLLRKGITPNAASFVGATSVRIHELGFEDRAPTKDELRRMLLLVKQAMEDGAMGLGSSLIYTPATFADTEELIALARVASAYGGIYTTHMRSEGDKILDAIDETIRISREATIPTEIYHLKINLPRNWPKVDTVLNKIDSARRAGIPLTANMYPYVASGTGLNSRLPAWVQEGGAVAMRKRISIKRVRRKVLYEMANGIPTKNSDPETVILMRFRLDSLNKLYRGKTLKEAATIHGKGPDETTIDLLLADRSRIEALYFQQSEDIVKKIMAQPYVSFGTDGGSYALDNDRKPEGDHPRAFGTFARVLGKYVREENVITLEEAIRRMTSLPAANLKLEKRGKLSVGYFADIVAFDAEQIIDRATYEQPHQYSEGVVHVFVNGVQVLADGHHTGAKPGRIIRGPGWIGQPSAGK